MSATRRTPPPLPALAPVTIPDSQLIDEELSATTQTSPPPAPRAKWKGLALLGAALGATAALGAALLLGSGDEASPRSIAARALAPETRASGAANGPATSRLADTATNKQHGPARDDAKAKPEHTKPSAKVQGAKSGKKAARAAPPRPSTAPKKHARRA